MHKDSCTNSKIGSVLLIVGGINWGLVGIGMLMGKMDSWNVVHMILGSIPWLEAVIYVLVGIAAVMMCFGCKCKKCVAACQACGMSGKGGMEGNNKMM
jgi:uncharacterized membrane protein YuzA (DUF378 family)